MSAWFSRPVTVLCALAAVLALAGVLLSRVELGTRQSSAASAYSVTIRHYGVDAREMERSVAVPLEDRLSEIPGATEVRSTSEYGKAQATIVLRKDDAAAYASVRDAAERVYAQLPRSAQRPEIASSSQEGGPAWVASMTSNGLSESELAWVVDKEVKPALEKIPGAGEVETAGIGVNELRVLVDDKAASALGIEEMDVAQALSQADFLFPAGGLENGDGRISVIADGRPSTVAALSATLVPSASGAGVPLGSIARVEEGSREPDTVSRVDGVKTLVAVVNPGGRANLMSLSKAIAAETKRLSARGISFKTISDSGAELSRSFSSIFSSVIQGMAAVALAMLLCVGFKRSGAIATVSVPVFLVLSAAAMAALGYPMDTWVLAGLAIGLGTAVDSTVLIAERLKNSVGGKAAAEGVRGLLPSLLGSAATTLVVLPPLAGLEFASEGLRSIAVALAVVVVVALIGGIAFLPPFLAMAPRPGKRREAPGRVANGTKERIARSASRSFRRLSRSMSRSLALLSRLDAKRPWIVLGASLVLAGTGILALAGSELDLGESPQGGTIYAHVEAEPGATVESVDRRLEAYAKALKREAGIMSVQTTARASSGSATVVFDPKKLKRKKATELVRRYGESIPNGFVYVQEGASGERSYELTFSGDDDARLREIASRTASAIVKAGFSQEVVLNFKDGPERILLVPDRERQAALGVDLLSAADAVRRAVHGPVAYKRVFGGKETDVRVTSSRKGKPSPEELAAIPIKSGGGAFVSVGAFLDQSRDNDSARIQRKDRRRIASISVRMDQYDARAAKRRADAVVKSSSLPSGYSYEFDKKAIDLEKRMNDLAWSFVLALAFSFIVLAAITESFGAPLAILSALPVSVGVPAIAMRLTGTSFKPAMACAFVVMAGMAVNAAVLIVEERRARSAASGASGKPGALGLYRMIRARTPSLIATCGTTVAGSLPILLNGAEGAELMRSLAFATVWGVSTSFVAAITVVPALCRLFPNMFESYRPRGGSLGKNLADGVKGG